MFKLNVKKKEEGKIDLSTPAIWTMLIKPQIQDSTLFVHIHCHFSEKEESCAISKYEGWMKDGKFVPIHKNSKHYNYSTPHQAHQAYINYVKDLLLSGYIRHDEMYLGGNPGKPHYIPDPTTEKESEDVAQIQAAIKTLKGNGSIDVGLQQILAKGRKHLRLGKPQVIDLKQNNTNTQDDEEQNAEEIGGS